MGHASCPTPEGRNPYTPGHPSSIAGTSRPWSPRRIAAPAAASTTPVRPPSGYRSRIHRRRRSARLCEPTPHLVKRISLAVRLAVLLDHVSLGHRNQLGLALLHPGSPSPRSHRLDRLAVRLVTGISRYHESCLDCRATPQVEPTGYDLDNLTTRQRNLSGLDLSRYLRYRSASRHSGQAERTSRCASSSPSSAAAGTRPTDPDRPRRRGRWPHGRHCRTPAMVDGPGRRSHRLRHGRITAVLRSDSRRLVALQVPPTWSTRASNRRQPRRRAWCPARRCAATPRITS